MTTPNTTPDGGGSGLGVAAFLILGCVLLITAIVFFGGEETVTPEPAPAPEVLEPVPTPEPEERVLEAQPDEAEANGEPFIIIDQDGRVLLGNGIEALPEGSDIEVQILDRANMGSDDTADFVEPEAPIKVDADAENLPVNPGR